MAQEKKSVYSILRGKYPVEECVLMQEVSDATGSGRSRSLDFMVVNLWQSRGLHITGIELKSHRSDWLREIKNPKKQENHFKYCDYFYLLTENDTVAKLDEIPETWGWMNIKGGKVYLMKMAPKLVAEQVPRTFLCAMLRRAASKDGFIHKSTIEEEIEKASERKKEYHDRDVKYKLEELESLKKDVKEFEESSGLNFRTYGWGKIKSLGAAINYVINHGLEDYKSQLERMKTSVTFLKEKIDKAALEFETIKIDLPDED